MDKKCECGCSKILHYKETQDITGYVQIAFQECSKCKTCTQYKEQW